MGHFHYARHFGVLGAATIVLFGLSRWDLISDSLVVSFALSGALHAGALVLALRTPQGLMRKSSFIALAAALSVFTMYIGILGLVLFAALPGNERLYAVLGLCSLTGAITYGSLIRLFWIRKFSSRLILSMAFLCVLATWLAFLAKTHADFLGGWWLAAAWWFTLSGALRFFDTHPNALSRSQYNSP
jgi:hypothetical protein